MQNKPSFEGLLEELRGEIEYYGGQLPERNALVWEGYYAALVVWGLISAREHEILTDMLPKIEDNPVIALLVGRPDDDAD